MSARAAAWVRAALTGALLPAALVGGCAFAQPPPPVEDTRVVAAAPHQALDRARRWLATKHFRIEKDHRRRDGGVIKAQRQPFDEDGYARCAWTFVMSGGAEPSAKVAVHASSDRPGFTRVRADVDISLVNRFGDRAECASNGNLEAELFRALGSG